MAYVEMIGSTIPVSAGFVSFATRNALILYCTSQELHEPGIFREAGPHFLHLSQDTGMYLF